MELRDCKEEITFTIPGIGISMNCAYSPIGRGKLVMVKRARDFKEKVITFTPYFKVDVARRPLFSFESLIYDNWYTKSGDKLLRKDIQNLLKILIDSVMYKIGLDDSSIWDCSIRKVQETNNPKIIVRLRVLEYLIKGQELTAH